MKNQVRSRRGISLLLTLLMVVGLFHFGATSHEVVAAVTDAPSTEKQLIDNGDGTYTLALSVTGEAASSSTTETTKANVILVLDTSSSMNQSSGSTNPYVYTEYTGAGTQGGEYYGVDEEGEYYRVYWRNNAWRTRNQNNAPVYNGTVYTRTGGGAISRIQAEKDALTKDGGIIDNLLSQNVAGDPVKSDIIEVAVVNFGGSGTTAQTFTTNGTSLKNTINNLSTSTGTNWEEGLMRAQELAANIKASQPNEDIYVIFLTDGEPTTHYNDYTVNTNFAQEWAAANDNAREIVEDGYHFYGIFTWGSGNSSHYLSSLVQYAYTGTGNSNSELQPAYAQYFTDATDTETLIEALTQITHDITQSVGYTNVELEDGVTQMTTSSVKVSASGEVTGLKYYRSGGSYSTTANGGLGDEWTDAPTATINDDGEVDWDLGNIVLENGVTYTVSFTVWPSQESLDLVADLNNEIISYDSLTPDQKSQIAVSGGTYTLKTNTDYPTVTYSTVTTTTIDGETTTVVSDPQTATIVNPDPVGLAESKLNAVKAWEDTLDPSQREEIEDVVLYLKMDGDYYYKDESGTPMGVMLTEDSGWTVTDYISIAPGLMVTEDSPAYDPDAPHVTYGGKTYAILERGHEYVFEESDINNHFELTAYTHHPMIMGSDGLKDVIFTKDASGNITGIESVSAMGDNISATNTLKGGINITKKVVDETGAEIDNTDPFTVKVTMTDPDGNALPIKKTASGTEYTIDYRIYYGPNNPQYDASVGGGRSDHIYKTGTEFEETIYVGDTIRVVNVEDGTIYKVEETAPVGYEYVGTEYSIAYGTSESGSAEAVPEGQDPTVEGNSASYAVVTNKYTFGDLKVSKTVEVETGDVEQAKDKEFEFTFKLYADDTKAEELTGLKYDYTKTDAEGNTSTGSITEGGTFKLKDGENIVIKKLPEGSFYEITEAAVTGYETTSEGDTGTIVKNETAEADFTNTYSVTPVIVDPPVMKEITGNPDLYNNGGFTFVIENVQAPDGVTAPMPDNTSITNSAQYELADRPGYYEFGEIEFTQPGTYKYQVTESGTVPGVTNDSESVKAIVFTVTDNGDGTMTVDPTTDDAVFSFTNVYDAEGKGKIEVEKELVGAEWPAGKTLTFTISGTGSAPMPETTTATLTEEGTVSFDIDYALSDAGKTYTYTISEDGFGGAWTGSGPVTATVTIEDAGDGTLDIDVTYSDDNNVITNTYVAEGDAMIEVTKAVAGADWPEGKTLTFTLSGTDAPMPDTVTATLSAPGKVSFGPISYDENDAGKTYTYTVSEDGFGDGWTPSGDITATVKVVDNGDGTLETTVTYSPENAIITNTYKATGSVELEASKELVGREWADGETVTFTLLGPDGSKIEDKAIGENGTITFTEIEYDESDAGKSYEYTISETSALPGGVTKSEDIKAKVTVTDNGDGTLDTSVEYTENDKIINTYTTDPVKAQINVSKEITGYIPGEDPNGNVVDRTFNFTMTGPKIDGELTASITTVNGKGGPVAFDEIEFTFDDMVNDDGEHVTEKQFTYEVKETAGSDPGYTYSTDTYTVVVTVVDDQEGHLEVKEITKVDDTTNVNVVNEFVEESVDVQLHLTKVIEDQSDSAEDATFTFQLKDAEGNVVEEKTITTSGLTGSVDFTPINFTEAGTYNYTLQEIAPVSSGDDTSDDSGESAAEVPDSSETVEEPKQTEEVQDGSETEDVTAEVGPTEEATDETAEDTSENKEEEQNAKAADTKAADSDSGSGWTYDTKEYPVVITITDNFETAQLEATVEIDGTETTTLTVTNIYKAASTEATIEVYKEIDDKSGSAYETTFEFTLKDSDGNELGVKTVTGPGKVSFDAISYEKAGTYNYTIKETEGDAAGYTYDTTEYPVVVTVEDVEGKLVATVDYGQVDSTELTVTNIYDPKDAEATPQARKVVDDKSGSAPDETFEFQLLDSDGEVVETVTKENGGYVYFSTLTFDTVGTYTYTIKEVSGNTAGFTYDTEGRDLEIVVTDEGKGSLVAEIDYLTDEGEAVITNEYKAEPTSVKFDVTKVVEGLGEGAEPVDFTFTLTDSDGKAVQTITITGSGTAEFDEIKYEKAGTYEYTITEKNDGAPGYTYDGSQYTVEVTVTDNGGKLVADKKITKDGEDTDKITFTNTYEAEPSEVEFNAKKTLVGRDLKAGEFEFVLEIDGEVVETVKNTAAGDVTFSTVKFDEPGTHTFKIYEVKGDLPNVTYDETVYEGTITVTDNGQGQLEAEVEGNKDIKFINNYENITPPPPPKTGDNSNLTMWLILMSVALIGIAGLVIFVRRRSRE
jgi:pilin isopeptide linkage protein/LPXTG-motif cell wall-anchored protein